MITYKDTTFCSSKTHKEDCNRKITGEELAQAKELGIPIAYADFCGENQ